MLEQGFWDGRKPSRLDRRAWEERGRLHCTETRAARAAQYGGRKWGTALLVAFHVLGKPGGEVVPRKRVRIED